MERLCLVIYETSETEKKALHDSLAAYSIAENVELIIKWLKPSAKEKEIVSACTEAQIAFVNASDIQKAEQIGSLLYQTSPTCALTYYGYSVPQDVRELIAYFSKLFPARPILYLDSPREEDFYQALRTLSNCSACQKRFGWETKGTKYRIPYDSILYFRSERNYVIMRLKNGDEYSFLGKLTNVDQQLPADLFVRVHQSYLISKAEIRLIDKQKKTVRLSSGEDIYISKAHYKETLEI